MAEEPFEERLDFGACVLPQFTIAVSFDSLPDRDDNQGARAQKDRRCNQENRVDELVWTNAYSPL